MCALRTLLPRRNTHLPSTVLRKYAPPVPLPASSGRLPESCPSATCAQGKGVVWTCARNLLRVSCAPHLHQHFLQLGWEGALASQRNDAPLP